MPDGKICYLEIPATDIGASAKFYTTVFGWKVRTRDDGSRAFDDTTGEMSGSWVTGRPPNREAGIITYVMVDDVDAALRKITKAGGSVVTPRTAMKKGEAYATFRDPAGNLFGIYQQPRSK